MRTLVLTHVLAMLVAASYVTLAVAARDTAQRWALAYGVATLVLAVVNLAQERRRR